jgi:hypothetical protein
MTARREATMPRIAALIAVALMLVPSLAAAQGAEPVGTVSDDETTVSRAYDTGDVQGIFGIFALGSVADSETQAMGMMTTLPAVIASGMSGTVEDAGAVVQPPEPVTVAAIGDQATGTRLPYTMFGSVDGEVMILAVRQSTWVQLLIGMGIGEADIQTQLEGLARTILPRWPSASPVTVRPDGLRDGGIWAMMPLPEDVPAGYTVDPDIEEGPAAPTGPGATSPAPSTDLPLLPTPTPASGQVPAPAAPETPVPPVIATQPPAEVATPAPNPRVALPFDVTVEIFLPLGMATENDDGSCSGSGFLDGLSADGQVTLQGATGDDASASAPMSGPGQVALDRETGEEVCYFRATLTDVPARARYTLLAGETVLGRYTYGDLTETGSILVVIGEE